MEKENEISAWDSEKKEQRKKPWYFIVGLLICALAVFGAVRLVSLCVSAVRNAAQEKQLIRSAEYNSLLIPAAAIDIEPFDDITGASMQELVEMSVWSVLNSAKDPSVYNYSNGELTIPEFEVEGAYVSFFGDERPIVHCTVSGYGYEFVYDDIANCYKIPLTSITPLYTPKLISVETKGDSTVITCGLVNSGLYTQDPLTGELVVPEPDKYIKMTLRKGVSGNRIRAIQSSGIPETASVPASEEQSGE